MSEPPETARPDLVEPSVESGHPPEVSGDRAEAPAPVRSRHRGRRVGFWAAVVVALAALVGGGYLAATSYITNTAPKTVATDYLHALATGDAPAALSYGELPSGSQDLLTSDVLKAQLGIAPMTAIAVGPVHQDGDHATVEVHYQLGFSGDPAAIDDTLALTRAGRTWRLDAVAIPISVHVGQAANRASLAGAKVPTGSRLVFPGAVPIEFDTDALDLTEDTRLVTFSERGDVEQRVELSAAGRDEVGAAVDAAMTACLDGSATQPTLCPLPADLRAVPGTLTGSMTKPASAVIDLTVEPGPDGIIHIAGTVPVTGDYKQLDFNNQQVTKSGAQSIPIVATCYATSPDTIIWRTQ